MVKLAKKNEGLIVPGYTHLQRAQPILLQHLLLAYVEQVCTTYLMQYVYDLVNCVFFFFLSMFVALFCIIYIKFVIKKW